MSNKKYPGDFIDKVICGDCIEVMKAMKPNSVDAIVTDPPYGLEFMGKDWDKLDKPGRDRSKAIQASSFGKIMNSNYETPRVVRSQRRKCNVCGGYSGGPFKLCSCDNPKWIPSPYPVAMQLWHTQWLTEAYRVLKPGGSMLVMGGTRTSHRLACAIEDTGFIIKDTLMWIYGSGFPKAQDLGKMIDKRAGKEREIVGTYQTGYNKSQKECGYRPNEYELKLTNPKPLTELAKYWDGFKVGGIKPAYEPIIWAVKPPEGSYVDNVLKHGVGFINVDETRIGMGRDKIRGGCINRKEKPNSAVKHAMGNKEVKEDCYSKGRFPANVILSHHPECVQVGVKRVKGIKGGRANQTTSDKYGEYANKWEKRDPGYTDPDGLETVESWHCHSDCAVRILDEQSGNLPNNYRKNKGIGKDNCAYFGNAKSERGGIPYTDNGGASRFFYCAKASRAERNAGLEGMEEKTRAGINKMMGNEKGGESMKTGSGNIRNNKLSNSHPTVKPIKLFEWLIKLVTREGQVILDPFIGSGTTIIAAHNTGRKCMGIEKEEEYIGIAKARIRYWKKRGRQLRLL